MQQISFINSNGKEGVMIRPISFASQYYLFVAGNPALGMR
jgi:hypothetical protein